jgi:hypothetical protein
MNQIVSVADLKNEWDCIIKENKADHRFIYGESFILMAHVPHRGWVLVKTDTASPEEVD